jgi:hypothetical protein
MERSSWHQERADIRTGGIGLEDNEEASKRTTAAFMETMMRAQVPPGT